MGDFGGIGRLLIGAGVVLIVLGAVVLLGGRTGLLSWLGRLPGDLVFRRGETTIFIPLATSLVVSIVLSLGLALLLRR